MIYIESKLTDDAKPQNIRVEASLTRDRSDDVRNTFRLGYDMCYVGKPVRSTLFFF